MCEIANNYRCYYEDVCDILCDSCGLSFTCNLCLPSLIYQFLLSRKTINDGESNVSL